MKILPLEERQIINFEIPVYTGITILEEISGKTTKDYCQLKSD